MRRGQRTRHADGRHAFDSFDAFQAAFDCPEAHWAIDVYTPPDDEYRKIHEWTGRLHTRGYQLGRICALARTMFRTTLVSPDDDADLSVFFTPTGTAANALARTALLDHNKSLILCSALSHQADREAGSVESLTGSRCLKPSDIFTAEEIGGAKLLDIDRLPEGLRRRDGEFLNQRPWMISLSVPMEDGSIPSMEYIRKVASFAERHGLLFHMDGARLFIAAAALGRSLKELTVDLGVDIFLLGGSKVGMVGADAVVFTQHFYEKYPRLHPYESPSASFDHLRSVLKRIGGLSGRSEESAMQFARALTDDYGIRVGRRAYESALALGERVAATKGVALHAPVETNVVCVRISKDGYQTILKKRYPYMKLLEQHDHAHVVRFMASHATTARHIDEAAKTLAAVGAACPISPVAHSPSPSPMGPMGRGLG